MFRKQRTEKKHLLACLFSFEPTQTPVMSQNFNRKDYSYLKPHIIVADSTKRELNKLWTECRMWLEKTLSDEDRWDERLIYASIKSVINPERDPQQGWVNS